LVTFSVYVHLDKTFPAELHAPSPLDKSILPFTFSGVVVFFVVVVFVVVDFVVVVFLGVTTTGLRSGCPLSINHGILFALSSETLIKIS